MAIAASTMTKDRTPYTLEELKQNLRQQRAELERTQELKHTAARYVCARCWEDLEVTTDPKTYHSEIHCSNPECGATDAYVTRRWVEQQEQEDHDKYLQAKANLRKMLPSLKQTKAQRSAADILKEI